MNQTLIITWKNHENPIIKNDYNKSLTKAFEIHNSNYKYVLEFGVCTGTTLMQLRSMFCYPDYIVYGFDSFKGLPEPWLPHIREGAFTTHGQTPEIPDTVIVPGLFADTIPIFKRMVSSINGIAVLHVDSDLYSSCKDILYGLNDYIKPNTIIVFDEWYYNRKDIPENRQHEQKCFYEWIKDCNRTFELIPQAESDVYLSERQIVKILS